jgi:hypothetical protein
MGGGVRGLSELAWLRIHVVCIREYMLAFARICNVWCSVAKYAQACIYTQTNLPSTEGASANFISRYVWFNRTDFNFSLSSPGIFDTSSTARARVDAYDSKKSKHNFKRLSKYLLLAAIIDVSMLNPGASN